MFRLVEGDWANQISSAMGPTPSRIRIICPFIKYGAAKDLFNDCRPDDIQVITRFDLRDFASGVSDTLALRFLLQKGAEIRGIKQLHSKMYLFDTRRAIVTSANLTRAALNSNHEVGFIIEEPQMVGTCHRYFERLWEAGEANVAEEKLEDWQSMVNSYLTKNPSIANRVSLPDYGVRTESSFSLAQLPVIIGDAPQAFVKFLGKSDNRESLNLPVLEEIKRGHCHRAVAYPTSKRPRSVQDGAIMYFGRLTRDANNKNDIRIFGRGIGMSYVEGRDDVTPEELEDMDWLENWSRYIRVHDTEFIDGTMGDGVSLAELMAELGPNSFASTKRNASRGEGNLNPRKSLMQQAAVELSPEGKVWLDEKLEEALAQHGILSPEKYDHFAPDADKPFKKLKE